MRDGSEDCYQVEVKAEVRETKQRGQREDERETFLIEAEVRESKQRGQRKDECQTFLIEAE